MTYCSEYNKIKTKLLRIVGKNPLKDTRDSGTRSDAPKTDFVVLSPTLSFLKFGSQLLHFMTSTLEMILINHGIVTVFWAKSHQNITTKHDK